MVLSSFRRPQRRSRRWNARHDNNSELRTKLFKMKSARITAISIYLALFLSVTYPNIASGYSVLTHEAIVDAAWNISIRPILLQRFPNATPEELKQRMAMLMAARSFRIWVITLTAAIFSPIWPIIAELGTLSWLCFEIRRTSMDIHSLSVLLLITRRTTTVTDWASIHQSPFSIQSCGTDTATS
jgi:hypothetical protein